MPQGTDLDKMFGPLPIATSRRGNPSAKIPSAGKLLGILEKYVRNKPGPRITFSFIGEYGVERGLERRWHLVIPASWCATDEPREIWRCVSLVLRLELLHGYSRVAKPNEPFTVDMREAIVDGLAFFLHIRSVADGEDTRAYEQLRERVLMKLANLHMGSFIPHEHLYAKFPYACEAHAWLRSGLVCRSLDGENNRFLDERHFAHWLAHEPCRPMCNLVGIMSLVERSLYGTREHLSRFYGARTVILVRSAELLKKLPAPWDIPTLFVAEAIDRAVREELFVEESAIAHVEYALAATEGQETLRRLLSPFGDPDAQSNVVALRA